MADLVDVLIDDQRWADFGLADLAETACRACLTHLDYPPADFEISLLGCDDARISQLNSDFRAKPAATNVLSWPTQNLAQNPVLTAPGLVPSAPKTMTGSVHGLGDIAIAYETCMTEARVSGKLQDRHVFHLLVHATLHLFGYDHIVTEDAILMEETERQVLASVGHRDPYD